MIAVIRSTGSNFASVRFAVERLGRTVTVTEDPDVIRAASHVILPGVGSAATGMRKLEAAGLTSLVPTLTQPVLGICLGMQVMFEGSDEGDVNGLGIFRGTVRQLEAAHDHPVPHMGWNTVSFRDNKSASVLADVPDAGWAYFVHSFAAPVGPDTVATTAYTESFTSVVARDNFVGVQFHPERSAEYGSAIIRSFLRA